VARAASLSLWHAFLAIDTDDFEALDGVRPGIHRRYGYVCNHTDDGTRRGVLVVWLDSSSRDDAMIKAAEVYVMLRSGAGLGWRDPRAFAAGDAAGSASLHDRLILDASELIVQQRYELVTLRVQTAAELAAERCFERLIGPKLTPKQQAKASRLIGRTLADERTRNIFEAITGLRPDAESWWPAYTQHLRRRNAVVHSGASVTQHDAEASVGAVLEYVAFMESSCTPSPPEAGD
jgi:hypothetical protein